MRYALGLTGLVLAAALTITLSDGTDVTLTDQQVDRIADFTEVAKVDRELVAQKIADRLGVTEEQALEIVKRVRGRHGRLPSTIHDERVGLLVANADAPRVNSALASSYCAPAASENENEIYSECLAEQAIWLSVRLCRKTNGAFAAVAGEWPTNQRVRSRQIAAYQALAPNPVADVIRDSTPQKILAAADARNLRRCEEGE